MKKDNFQDLVLASVPYFFRFKSRFTMSTPWEHGRNIYATVNTLHLKTQLGGAVLCIQCKLFSPNNTPQGPLKVNCPGF